MTEIDPANDLDLKLVATRAGETSMPDFLRSFCKADIVVPSGGEVLPDGSGFVPLLFDKAGISMVACFTARERIGDFARLTPFALMMRGIEFLRRIPAGAGVVVNPDNQLGFDIAPDGVRRIAAEFGAGTSEKVSENS